MAFRNTPVLSDEDNTNKVRKYVHQPLTIEHYGIHAAIRENGSVLISAGISTNTDGTEDFDEVEIQNQLVFELGSLLRATRTTKFANNSQGERVRIYTHQPLTVERQSVTFSIKENGKILLTSPDRLVDGTKDKYEYDEVEIPASLIFKLTTLLRATRTSKFVSSAGAD